MCGAGRALFNGACVSFDSSGVCTASNGLVVNSAKGKCDGMSMPYIHIPHNSDTSSHSVGCPSNCASCGILNFSVISTFDQVQCTTCLPGTVLYQGRCVSQCPAGTFIGRDGTTCQGSSDPFSARDHIP